MTPLDIRQPRGYVLLRSPKEARMPKAPTPHPSPYTRPTTPQQPRSNRRRPICTVDRWSPQSDGLQDRPGNVILAVVSLGILALLAYHGGPLLVAWLLGVSP